jgi:hypothetical protein
MRRSFWWAILGGLWLLNNCAGDDAEPAADCDGELGCACYPNGTCNVGLECDEGRCLPTPEDSAGATGSGGDPGDGSGGTDNSGGTKSSGGADNSGGANNAGGSDDSGGSGNSGGDDTGGEGGSGPATTGVPLTPNDGWVDGDDNSLGIQGEVFAYADDTTWIGMTEDFTGSSVCIKGTAAKVDLSCTPVAPATDCYGTYWGAAIGLNLNQAIDPTSEEPSDPLPFDAATKGVTGFAFEITGEAVPTSLRFAVEGPSAEYCTTSATPVKVGANSFSFGKLVTECWTTGGYSPTGDDLLKLKWWVVTNAASTVPFDFCVSNVRALTE